MTVTGPPEKKRGRPFLLGNELDKQIRDYLTSLSTHGAVVNTAIGMCRRGFKEEKKTISCIQW